MYEYILYHDQPFQLFIAWLKEKGVSVVTEIEKVDNNYVVKVSEDLDDALLDEIEDKYDEVEAMSEQIFSDEEKANNEDYHMAGVTVTLNDGSTSYADINPELMSKIIDVLTPEEFTEVVNAIANAVENPQSKSYCQRIREDVDSN